MFWPEKSKVERLLLSRNYCGGTMIMRSVCSSRNVVLLVVFTAGAFIVQLKSVCGSPIPMMGMRLLSHFQNESYMHYSF